MARTQMSATAKFIRNRFAIVYIFLPRMTTKQTQTLPTIPTNATIPIRMYIAKTKFWLGSIGPVAFPVVVVFGDDHTVWLKYPVEIGECMLLKLKLKFFVTILEPVGLAIMLL